MKNRKEAVSCELQAVRKYIPNNNYHEKFQRIKNLEERNGYSCLLLSID
jgi:hypothetical protein